VAPDFARAEGAGLPDEPPGSAAGAPPFTDDRARRAVVLAGSPSTNSGSLRTGAAPAAGAAFLDPAPRRAISTSPGEKGSSSRPKRTTTNSSDTAGSVSCTTCPICPAICPAEEVNTTFGRRPAASDSRIFSTSSGPRPRACARAAAMAHPSSFARLYE
jgi:hypothetical protein